MEDTANSPVEDNLEDGPGRVDQARQRIAEVGGRVGRTVSGAARTAGERSEVARDVAVENLKAGVDRVKKDLDGITDDVTTYVNDNPGRSVLIAAGVGFLVGMLMRGGRR